MGQPRWRQEGVRRASRRTVVLLLAAELLSLRPGAACAAEGADATSAIAPPAALPALRERLAAAGSALDEHASKVNLVSRLEVFLDVVASRMEAAS